MFSLTLLQRVFFYVRAEAKSALPRLLIRQACGLIKNTTTTTLIDIFTDCAEREATYIITTGGINDPERA
jgi:hypothetical protein